jgi:coenzyme F420-reducing hydrogenase beta subunit
MKEKTIQIILDNERCSGCSACNNVCQVNAIIMIIDDMGYYSAKINYEKCIGCGKCLEICPVNNYKNTDRSTPQIYSGWSKNEEYLKNSSSGGIFPEIAAYMIKKYQAKVYGAAWEKFPDLQHIKIIDQKEIPRLMSSKYIQSRLDKQFNEIHEYCLKGETVLFSGTPCQVAGLLKIVNSDNLYTIDLVCHGVPSRRIFLKYIEENGIKAINFRNKLHGWQNFMIYTRLKTKDKYTQNRLDPFFYGYLENYYLQKLCYNCPFSSLSRMGDITLGDFWGISKNDINQKGTSLIVINNSRGKELIMKMEADNLILIKPETLEAATKRNPRLISGIFTIPETRKTILAGIQNRSFKEISTKYFFCWRTVLKIKIRMIFHFFKDIV